MKPPRNTKDRLLEAATTLFAERGSSGTSVNEIILKARCNKRMVYHYFGSKEKLYRAVLLRAYEAMENFESGTLNRRRNASPRDLIDRMVRSNFRFLETHPRFVALLAWENLNQGRSIRHLPIRQSRNALFEALTDYLRRKHPRTSLGNVRQFFVSLTALCYFTYSNRHTMKRILGFDPAGRLHIDARIKHIVDLLSHHLE